MTTQHLEPLRTKREKSEEVFRAAYNDKIDDYGEFELMIAELKDGQITESIIRYLPAEVAMFAENCLALHRAEREQIRPCGTVATKDREER